MDGNTCRAICKKCLADFLTLQADKLALLAIILVVADYFISSFSVTCCHSFLQRDGQFCDFVFIRHTAHCFLLLVSCMLCVVKKHCPEEASLNRWAKRRLLIK